MFEFLSGLIKYLFVTAIYFFMFSIIRLIYLDIKQSRMGAFHDDTPYIKLINRRSTVPFRVEESYAIEDGATIGRSGGAKIIISDPFLSGVHVQFIKDGEFWNIIDNQSTNGTFVNGEKIITEPCAVKSGDIIKIGQLNFIFVEPSEDE